MLYLRLMEAGRGEFERRKGSIESCQQLGDLCSFGGGLDPGGNLWRGVFAEQPILSQVAERKASLLPGASSMECDPTAPPDTLVDVCKAARSGTARHAHGKTHMYIQKNNENRAFACVRASWFRGSLVKIVSKFPSHSEHMLLQLTFKAVLEVFGTIPSFPVWRC